VKTSASGHRLNICTPDGQTIGVSAMVGSVLSAEL